MFWDKAAAFYDIFQRIGNGKVNRELPEAVAELLRPEDEALECACGTGMITGKAAAVCRMVTATDISENMLRRAEKKLGNLPNVRFAAGDILRLAFDAGSFDVVIAANVLHLLPDPFRALSEFRRVTRAGGRLILPTYLIADDSGHILPKARFLARLGADFRQPFSRRTYEAFLRGAGFEPDIRVLNGSIPCAVASVTL